MNALTITGDDLVTIIVVTFVLLLLLLVVSRFLPPR